MSEGTSDETRDERNPHSRSCLSRTADEMAWDDGWDAAIEWMKEQGLVPKQERRQVTSPEGMAVRAVTPPGLARTRGKGD